MAIGFGQSNLEYLVFYNDAPNAHGLPHNPFKAIVSPRPIAWVSTLDTKGNANLAPYSFFNGVSDTPPIVGFSCGPAKVGIDEAKDTGRNIADTGEFCISIVPFALKDQMNLTSGHYPHGSDEFEHANLRKGASRIIAPPFVADSPAALECRLHSITPVEGGYSWIMGRVVGFHLDDDCIVDGLFDVRKYRPLARLGYRDYSSVDNVFSLTRPEEE